MSDTLVDSGITNLIVAGSRCYHGEVYRSVIASLLDLYLDGRDNKICIYSGLAKGPDKIALDYALDRDLAYRKFPADWDNLGKKAGIVRNCEMVDADAHELLAFWDLKSPGTKQVIEYGKSKGLLVNICVLPVRKPSQELESKFFLKRLDKEIGF